MMSVRSMQHFNILRKHISRTAIVKSCAQPTAVLQFVRNLTSAGFVKDDVLFEEKGGARIMTLNRPQSLNALTLSMIEKMYPKIKEWEEDPRTTMIIIKGAGEKAFCAGGDIRNVTDAAKMGDYKSGEEFFSAEHELNYRIATCLVPYIAFIDGITMGGGAGISVHGENRICTERTQFAMPECKIGLLPDVGSSYFLPRLSMHLGQYLALTGYTLKARDVYKAGIATRMVDSHVLPQLEQDLISMKTPSPQDITDLLRRYHEECQTGRERDYLILRDRENDIKRMFVADSVEQIFENLEEDGSMWAQEQLSILRKMSPTSLKLCHRLLMLGETLTLDECLELEYRVVCNCLRNHDFAEGVRSLVVDKDKNPKWKPSTLADVTDEMIDSYFKEPRGLRKLQL